jgi:phage terminase small subunit
MANVQGATRKTTAELALSGALDAKPGRYAGRRSEPTPMEPLGTPPDHLNTIQKAIWHEIADLCPPDVLFGSDRIVLEMVCRLIEKLRAGTIKALEQNLLLTSLQQLGMTPLARSRIAVPAKEKTQDDWASLLKPTPLVTAVCTPNDVHPESQ